ncbi:hypothetical protein J6590_018756 [Homalodisca vitripennis]|nr:hypothetical protein J6590_018756 [Homalodisca vitripennis]
MRFVPVPVPKYKILFRMTMLTITPASTHLSDDRLSNGKTKESTFAINQEQDTHWSRSSSNRNTRSRRNIGVGRRPAVFVGLKPQSNCLLLQSQAKKSKKPCFPISKEFLIGVSGHYRVSRRRSMHYVVVHKIGTTSNADPVDEMTEPMRDECEPHHLGFFMLLNTAPAILSMVCFPTITIVAYFIGRGQAAFCRCNSNTYLE